MVAKEVMLLLLLQMCSSVVVVVFGVAIVELVIQELVGRFKLLSPAGLIHRQLSFNIASAFLFECLVALSN